MTEQTTAQREPDKDKVRTIAVSAGILVAAVLGVAVLAAALAALACSGDDTRPSPPQGSTLKEACNNIPYGLGIIAAPLITLIGGVGAVRRRAWPLLVVGLVLGLAIAVTPFALLHGTSKDCPEGTHADSSFYCVP
jgi:hypothetical protein